MRRCKTLLLLLCAACLALAGWMVYHALSGAPMVGCGAGGGCGSVMGSRWAWFLGGVPVSLPAAVVYALMGLCVLFLGDASLDRLLWRLMPLLGGCIVGAALWFLWLQAGVLHAFCLYCTLLHTLGCVVSCLVFVLARRQGFRPVGPFVAGLAAAALFALIQSRTLPDNIYDAGRTDAPLPAFEEGEVPVLGEGEKALTLLFDFQCSHCRRLHGQLPELLALAEGQYRIFLCPVPLSSACNPYIPASGIDRFAGSCALTRLALAVWFARPETYSPFWDWLLGDGDSSAPPVTPAEAELRARALLGDSFEAAMADPRIDTYLRKVEDLFGRTSSAETSGIPRFIAGSRWLVPEAATPETLLSLLRETWPLEP